jgi:hypothetical protein
VAGLQSQGNGATGSSGVPPSPAPGGSGMVPVAEGTPGKPTPVQQLQRTGGWPAVDATIDTKHYNNVLLAKACVYDAVMTVTLNRKFVRLTGVAGLDDTADPNRALTLEISAAGDAVFEKTVEFGKTTVIDVRLNKPIKITIVVSDNCGTMAFADLAVS